MSKLFNLIRRWIDRQLAGIDRAVATIGREDAGR